MLIFFEYIDKNDEDLSIININSNNKVDEEDIFLEETSEESSEDTDLESNISYFIEDDEESSFEDSISISTNNFSSDDMSIDEKSSQDEKAHIEEIFTTIDNSLLD